jgi:ribosomal protein L11 methyltransferase
MTARLLFQIGLRCQAQLETPAVAALEAVARTQPVTYVDEDTRVCTVSVYRRTTRPAAAALALRAQQRLLRGFPGERFRRLTRKVKPQDWAESWKRHFKVLVIGDRLLVRPTWSRRRPRAAQVELVLDPGLSFGTGQHPTTRFCLEEIVARTQASENVSLIDVGTGSGILAIAAAKLGCRPVVAFDFDPVAVKAARANARLNGVSRHLLLRRADLAHPPAEWTQRYSLVCANLTSDLLLTRLRRLLRWLEPNGRLVLAGILRTQFPAVQAACETAGLHLVRTHAESEWQSGAFERLDTLS